VPTKVNFRVIDFTQIYRRHIDRFMPETRHFLTNHISNWMSDISQQQETPNVMWLTGAAGTGKSVISAKVLEMYFDTSLVGWHFCLHSKPADNTSIAILRSLTVMMMSNLPGYSDFILKNAEKRMRDALAESDPLKIF